MKEKTFIICLLFLGLLINGYGQHNELLLKNKTTGNELVIHEGSRLKITLKNGKVCRGELILKDTTSGLVENNQIIIRTHPDNNVFSFYKVNINDIKYIKTKPLSGKIIGSTLLGIGAGLFITLIIYNNNSQNQLNATQKQGGDTGTQPLAIFVNDMLYVAAGVVAITLGTVVLSSGIKYDIENWEFSIRTK